MAATCVFLLGWTLLTGMIGPKYFDSLSQRWRFLTLMGFLIASFLPLALIVIGVSILGNPIASVGIFLLGWLHLTKALTGRYINWKSMGWRLASWLVLCTVVFIALLAENSRRNEISIYDTNDLLIALGLAGLLLIIPTIIFQMMWNVKKETQKRLIQSAQ